MKVTDKVQYMSQLEKVCKCTFQRSFCEGKAVHYIINTITFVSGDRENEVNINTGKCCQNVMKDHRIHSKNLNWASTGKSLKKKVEWGWKKERKKKEKKGTSSKSAVTFCTNTFDGDVLAGLPNGVGCPTGVHATRPLVCLGDL